MSRAFGILFSHNGAPHPYMPERFYEWIGIISQWALFLIAKANMLYSQVYKIYASLRADDAPKILNDAGVKKKLFHLYLFKRKDFFSYSNVTRNTWRRMFGMALTQIVVARRRTKRIFTYRFRCARNLFHAPNSRCTCWKDVTKRWIY